MAGKTWHTQINAHAIVTDDDASADLFEANSDGQYLYLDNAIISVYKASDGAGGILEFLDTDGVVIHRMNADGVKDVFMPIGNEGLRIGQNTGIQILVSGADMQASVSVIATGHYNID